MRSPIPSKLLSFWCAVLCGSATSAQTMPRLPPPDNAVRSRMSAAQAQLDQGHYAEAVSDLQQIVDLPEDSFDPENPGQSFRARVEAIIGGLPAEGRDAYQRRFAEAAQVLLNEARRNPDPEALAEVCRRYFFTAAGRDATLELAARLSDAGEMLEAARLLDRVAAHPDLAPAARGAVLLRSAACWWIAGNAAAAEQRLVDWEQSASGAPPAVGASAVVTAQQAAEWLAAQAPTDAVRLDPPLAESMIVRGNPSRNGLSETAVPVGDVIWRYPLIDEYDDYREDRVHTAADAMDKLQQQIIAVNPERTLLPAGVPLLADDVAVVRGYGALKAVSLKTGKLLWSSITIDESFHHLLQNWRPDEDWHGDNLDLFLGQRAWRDQTVATLSTDGTYVFCLFDGGMVSSMGLTVYNAPDLMRHPLSPHSFNRLVAFELRHGRVKWERGGAAGPIAEPLAGVYFLGPPLPLDGRLYCLVEERGQVRLAVLDPRDGALLWSQALYNPAVNLSTSTANHDRRLAGLTPAARGGILVCPTGESAVVAVDIRRRELLWQQQYRQPDQYTPQQQMAIQMQMMRQQSGLRAIEQELLAQLLARERWFDSLPVIAGESVLITPPDSDAVHCLALLNGAELWRLPRGDALFLAAVHDDQVILVGTNEVRALRLEDGTPAWDAPVPIPAPSGRGFRHGRWYVLPLASGDVATIDLDAGRLVARSHLSGGDVPGNLVAADGRIVWQSVTGLAALQPLSEVTRDYEARLASSPADADALRLRGETRLHLGAEEAALADLRRSLELNDAPRTRDVLAAALIEGLRTDFDAYRGAAGEIERIVRDPAQRSLFLRLHAEGLQGGGEIEPAFREYLKFAVALTSIPGVERLDGQRSVRTDRLVQARLASLYRAADSATQARMRDEVARQVDMTLQAGDVAALFRLLPLIPDAAQAESVRFELAQRLTGVERLVEQELLLLSLLESADDGRRAFAAGRLAELYLETGEPDLLAEAAACLSGPLAEVAGLDGKTGRQLLEEWGADSTRADLFRRAPAWPSAKIDVDEQARGASAAGGMVTVRQLGPHSPVLRGWTWLIEPSGTVLQAFDANGTQKWQAPAVGALGAMRSRRGGNSEQWISTCGRLALFAADDQFTVFDAVSGKNLPVILASVQFQPQSLSLQPFIVFNNRRPPTATGVVGPLTPGCLVYQTGPTLQAIDPLTGDKLWSHEVPDLPSPPEQILGDENYIIVWPKTGNEVSIFSAIDGARIARRKLLDDEFKLREEAAWGRRMIRYAGSPGAEGLEVRLSLYDPVDDSRLWERTFPATSEWGRTDGTELYLLHRDGTLRFVDGLTGTDRLVTSIPVDPPPLRVSLVADDDRYFVATFHAPADSRQAADPLNRERPAVNGPVYAVDRRTGEVLWSQTVEQQQLMTGVPGDWPILPFVTQLARPTAADAPRQVGRAIAITLLDKATGRVLYQGEKPGQLDRLAWKSEASVHRLTVFAGPVAVALQFSAEGSEPDAPPRPQPDEK